MSLQAQIQPYLGTGSNTGLPDGVNPDQTFKAYVESLLDAKTKGFSGTFVGDSEEQQQQQEQTPTTSITRGLFSDMLPNTSGRGGGSRTTTNRDTTGQGIRGIDAQNTYANMMKYSRPLGSLVNTGLDVLGISNPFSMLTNWGINKLGAHGLDTERDAIGRSFDAMNNINSLGMPGMGTVSDAAGNIRSISNQALTDAADRAMFGVTGAELASGVAPAAVTPTADVRSILSGFFSGGLGRMSSGGGSGSRTSSSGGISGARTSAVSDGGRAGLASRERSLGRL
jgi:hypothetical protein